MSMFAHERLDVYQAAIEFLGVADQVAMLTAMTLRLRDPGAEAGAGPDEM